MFPLQQSRSVMGQFKHSIDVKCKFFCWERYSLLFFRTGSSVFDIYLLGLKLKFRMKDTVFT